MALGTTESDPSGAVPAYGSRRERIDAERGERTRVRRRARRPRRRPDLRHGLAGAAAALAVTGLVAVIALPAITPPADASAASGALSARTAAAGPLQRADVTDAVPDPASRDGVSVDLPAPLLKAASYGDVRLLDTGQLRDQPWALPVSGRITDGFGPRPDRPVAGVGLYHEGTDIGTACGTPIAAATRGTVVEAGWNGTYGNWILLAHGSGIQTGYAHIENGGILVAVGQTVDAGAQIARVGATGAATGCHLHFEVRIGTQAVDAVPFMARRGVALGAG